MTAFIDLLENCCTNPSDNSGWRTQSIYSIQILFFVTAGLFLVISALLLLLRRRRKRKELKEYDTTENSYDVEDYDDEDETVDYLDAFTING